MIKLENYEVMGWEHAIRGMRNPMNSWDKIDSTYCGYHEECSDCPAYKSDENGKLICTAYRGDLPGDPIIVGENDHKLMMNLAKGGSVHAKYRRMITVYVDITAPLYWWKEFDTYKVGTDCNSCSTMHKIHEKEFTLDDFSHEHLMNFGGVDTDDRISCYEASYSHARVMSVVIASLNGARDRYLDYKSRGSDYASRAKDSWWQMIQLLPSSYNQRRTIKFNYEVLANIYHSRRNHKLDEWVAFCKWIESLPYSELITCEVVSDE